MPFKDPADQAAYTKRWREANKELLSKKRKERYYTHLEKEKATLQAYTKTPKGRYVQQKQQSIARGISWEISFEEWWSLWELSGKWEQRGFAKGKYCMCRNGDVGPYSVDNVRIDTTDRNKSERWGTL